jgi:putative glycosyltransferase (TIGR04372 family)
MSTRANHDPQGQRSTRRPPVVRQLVGFLADQSRKTIRRPSRIFIIAWYLMLRPLRLPAVPRRLVGLAELPWPGPIRRLLLWLFPSVQGVVIHLEYVRGAALLDQNRPLEAYAALTCCLEKSTEPGHFFLGAACLMVGLGRFREAMSAFARANELRWQRARSLGLADSRLRFLPTIWHSSFGHLAQIDYLAKLGILDGRAPEETVLYTAPDAPVPNRFLLDQWRPYLKVVERASDLPLPNAQMEALSFDFLAPRLADGTTVHLWQLAATTYRRWHGEGRGPLLALPAEIVQRGWSVLESVGIPRGAWFVALHVREPASKALHARLHNVLNARVDEYLPAIEEITRRGGWVVALGDPRMTPLPPLPQVLDYRHSRVRADWMDIFLCAQARFFLGTSSGPAYVPPIYGVSAVLTNWWPPAQKPWHPTDIFIPKLYRDVRDGRLLNLDESLAEPFGYCNSVDYLTKTKGVIVEDNEAEDIRLAVVEMLERLDGRTGNDRDVLELRARADGIYAGHGIHGMSLLARDFLRKHRFFAAPSVGSDSIHGD